jgi:hypothetical protein
MDEKGIVRPNLWCQEEIWRLIRRYEVALSYLDDPWFPSVVRLKVAADEVILQDEELMGSIELRKGLIAVKTRPCTMFVTRYEIELYQCTIWDYKKGTWLWVDRSHIPFHNKEYYEAKEIYERLRHIFKVLAGYITDKLSF